MVVYPFYRRRVCSVKCAPRAGPRGLSTASRPRSEEHTSELQSQSNLVCRLLLEKKKNQELSHGQNSRQVTHRVAVRHHRISLSSRTADQTTDALDLLASVQAHTLAHHSALYPSV